MVGWRCGIDTPFPVETDWAGTLLPCLFPDPSDSVTPPHCSSYWTSHFTQTNNCIHWRAWVWDGRNIVLLADWWPPVFGPDLIVEPHTDIDLLIVSQLNDMVFVDMYCSQLTIPNLLIGYYYWYCYWLLLVIGQSHYWLWLLTHCGPLMMVIVGLFPAHSPPHPSTVVNYSMTDDLLTVTCIIVLKRLPGFCWAPLLTCQFTHGGFGLVCCYSTQFGPDWLIHLLDPRLPTVLLVVFGDITQTPLLLLLLFIVLPSVGKTGPLLMTLLFPVLRPQLLGRPPLLPSWTPTWLHLQLDYDCCSCYWFPIDVLLLQQLTWWWTGHAWHSSPVPSYLPPFDPHSHYCWRLTDSDKAVSDLLLVVIQLTLLLALMIIDRRTLLAYCWWLTDCWFLPGYCWFQWDLPPHCDIDDWRWPIPIAIARLCRFVDCSQYWPRHYPIDFPTYYPIVIQTLYLFPIIVPRLIIPNFLPSWTILIDIIIGIVEDYPVTPPHPHLTAPGRWTFVPHYLPHPSWQRWRAIYSVEPYDYWLCVLVVIQTFNIVDGWDDTDLVIPAPSPSCCCIQFPITPFPTPSETLVVGHGIVDLQWYCFLQLLYTHDPIGLETDRRLPLFVLIVEPPLLPQLRDAPPCPHWYWLTLVVVIVCILVIYCSLRDPHPIVIDRAVPFPVDSV